MSLAPKVSADKKARIWSTSYDSKRDAFRAALEGGQIFLLRRPMPDARWWSFRGVRCLYWRGCLYFELFRRSLLYRDKGRKESKDSPYNQHHAGDDNRCVIALPFILGGPLTSSHNRLNTQSQHVYKELKKYVYYRRINWLENKEDILAWPR